MGDTPISSLKVAYSVHKFLTDMDRGKRLMLWDTRIKLTLAFMGNKFRLLIIDDVYLAFNLPAKREVSVCVCTRVIVLEGKNQRKSHKFMMTSSIQFYTLGSISGKKLQISYYTKSNFWRKSEITIFKLTWQ